MMKSNPHTPEGWRVAGNGARGRDHRLPFDGSHDGRHAEILLSARYLDCKRSQNFAAPTSYRTIGETPCN
jgi:hypothetical protein